MQTASPWKAGTEANMVENMVVFNLFLFYLSPLFFCSILVLVDPSIIAPLTYPWSYFHFDGPSWYVFGGVFSPCNHLWDGWGRSRFHSMRMIQRLAFPCLRKIARWKIL